MPEVLPYSDSATREKRMWWQTPTGTLAIGCIIVTGVVGTFLGGVVSLLGILLFVGLFFWISCLFSDGHTYLVFKLYSAAKRAHEAEPQALEAAKPEDYGLFDLTEVDDTTRQLEEMGFKLLGDFLPQRITGVSPWGMYRQLVHKSNSITCTITVTVTAAYLRVFRFRLENYSHQTTRLCLGSVSDDGMMMITHRDTVPRIGPSHFVAHHYCAEYTKLCDLVDAHKLFVSEKLKAGVEHAGEKRGLRPVQTVEQVRSIETDFRERLHHWRSESGYLTPEELDLFLTHATPRRRQAEMVALKHLRARDGFETFLPVEELVEDYKSHR